jgi:hypothetical protein
VSEPVVSKLDEEQEPSMREVQIVVPAAEAMSMDEVRAVVGAKNVMGTCSG